MAKPIEYELPSGAIITIEPGSERSGTGMGAAAGGSRGSAEKAAKTFADAMVTVQEAAETALSALIAVSPSRMEMEFGIKASANAGFMIASTEGEVAFKVKLVWDGAAEHNVRITQG